MDDLVCDTGFVLTQTTIFFKASGEPEVERIDLFLYPTTGLTATERRPYCR